MATGCTANYLKTGFASYVVSMWQ